MSEQGWLVMLLIICTSACDVSTEHKTRPGGLTETRPADENTQNIADEVALYNQQLDVLIEL